MLNKNNAINPINSLPCPKPASGIVISHFYNKGKVFLKVQCTRNIEFAKHQLETFGIEILHVFPVLDRDTQGKRLLRMLKRNLGYIAGKETSFIINISDARTRFLQDLQARATTQDYKAVRQSLKAILRKAIHDETRRNRKRNIKVSDIINQVLPVLDGLNIELYLNWLAEDGIIKLRKAPSIFDTMIIPL